MNHQVRFSGSGGQGIILASIIVGSAAALHEGKNVVQSQTYGPEARGGASKADVIISDKQILFPKAIKVDFLVTLTQKAATKFVQKMNSGGVIILDSDFVDLPESPDYKLVRLPMTSSTMEKFGSVTPLNVVSVGAWTEISGLLSPESVRLAVLDNSPRGFAEMNEASFELGRQLARNHAEAAHHD